MNEWKKFVLIEGFIEHFLFTRHCSRCFTYINSFNNKWINKLKLKSWPITQLNAFPKGQIIFPKVISAWKIPFQQPAVVVAQLLSCPTLLTPGTAAQHLSLFSTVSWSLLKLMSLVSAMPSNHLALCCLLLLPSTLPSIRVFSNKLALCVRWPKYWSFSFSISSSNEYSGMLSFRIDCFDLLAVHWTLKSLLQHHISKASLLWRPAFFMVQISLLYMSIGKTTAFTMWTCVSKMMLLLLEMLSLS